MLVVETFLNFLHILQETKQD